MTRKDYELIAAAIREMPDFAVTLRRSQWDAARTLAGCLAAANPRFSPARFMAAALSERTAEAYAGELDAFFLEHCGVQS